VHQFAIRDQQFDIRRLVFSHHRGRTRLINLGAPLQYFNDKL
jgi:hypothetical protein